MKISTKPTLQVTAILVFCVISLAIKAQTTPKIDSLHFALLNASQDSTKGRIAEDLNYEYYAISLDSCLKYAKLSESYALKTNDIRMLAQSHNSQGIAYLNKSSVIMALDHFQKAYELYMQIGDQRGQGKMLNNLGVIYTQTQDYERARDKYEKAYKLNDEIGYWEAASNALFNISGSYFSLKDYEKSLQYANELRNYHALHLNTTSPNNLYGDIFEVNGKLDSARFYIEAALEEQKTNGDLYSWCNSVINLARIVMKQGHALEADKILTTSYKTIIENEMIEYEYSYLALKAEIHYALNYPSMAYNFQRQAMEVNDSIDHMNQMNMIQDMSAKYETDRMESQINAQQVVITNTRIWLATNIIVAVLLGLGLFSVIHMLRKNRKLNKILKGKNLQISHQRQKIISSINYAKRIQQSTLPKEVEFKKLFKDSFIYFKPKDIISGDFYAYQKVDSKIYVAAIDCTGHGVPGAFMSLIANSKLNKVVNELGERDPGQILTSLHKEIQNALHQEEGTEHTMDGVEMSLCAIDLERCSIEFAGAGASIFIVKKGVIQEYKGNLNGLGGADYRWSKGQESQTFATHTISYESEDLLYLFSDGIHDQIGGNDLKKLNKTMFKEHLIKLSQHALDNASHGCEEFINQWKRNQQQTDDMMLIGIRL